MYNTLKLKLSALNCRYYTMKSTFTKTNLYIAYLSLIIMHECELEWPKQWNELKPLLFETKVLKIITDSY